MRLVIQRVLEAQVSIDGKMYAKIKQGLLIFIGIEDSDSSNDIDYLASKVCNLRIFSDLDGKMNLNLRDTGGEILVISQFTLHAKTKKGNRPSFIRAAKPEYAIPIYNGFCTELETLLQKQIQTGEFGAEMKVNLVNDGPVTILMDSKHKQ
ncbi:MAG: D-tyrosyl-tRNA(Tyr) deacylase [Cryomorphaceae bacterium]|nr:D-tyrosyl-tRNA(Tyr) deacylase [Cryomorphaceae bacterium]|tara:strand:- start:1613 stop:2065 length:453 start_codon:yes stop_codon:yes gene_type:complete